MSHYALRLTPIDDNVIDMLSDLHDRFVIGKYAQAIEESDKGKTHFHLWVETDKSDQTLRNFLLKQGYKGNKTYSLTPVKDEKKYLAYLMKEDSNVVLEGFSEAEVAAANEYDLQVKSSKKAKSVKLSDIEDLFPRKQVLKHGNQVPIMMRIIDFYLENQLTIRRHIVQNLYINLLAKYDPSYKRHLAEEFLKFL